MEVWVVLQRHRGSIARLMEELDRSYSTIHDWLRGSLTSAYVAKGCREKANKLLALEQQQQCQQKQAA